MPPSQAEGHEVIGGRQQVAVLVIPLVFAELVPDAPVQLDDHAEALVAGVAIDDPVLGALTTLSIGPWQSVDSLDPAPVARLEQRLNPVCSLLEYAEQPTSMLHAGPSA
jgi:hypothetical protein